MDGLVIIDSDPGGYPEFHQQGIRRSAGAPPALARSPASGRDRIGLLGLGRLEGLLPDTMRRANSPGGTEPEFLETLTLLKEQNPEPWGMARGLEYAKKLGLQSKVINFNYGAIELEPVFPMTNFGPHAGGDPYKSGQDHGAAGNAGQRPDPLRPVARHFCLRPRRQRVAADRQGLPSFRRRSDCRPRRADPRRAGKHWAAWKASG